MPLLAAGTEQLALREMNQRLLNLPPEVELVQLPAPYNTTVSRTDLFRLRHRDVLAEIARYSNVDSLSLKTVESHTVRVEPPPPDPGRPRWSWGIAQMIERYDEILGKQGFRDLQTLGFPTTEAVRQALAARPVSTQQVRSALVELTDAFEKKLPRVQLPLVYTFTLDTAREILANAIQAVPFPLENARQAARDLVQAALDHDVPLRIYGSERAARSPSGNPVALLDARRLLQNNPNVVLLELSENGALFLKSQQPGDMGDSLEAAALRLNRRLEGLLAGRPQALASLTGLSLAHLLQALQERGNWESLEIYHEETPAVPQASVTGIQDDAKRQFTRSFMQVVPLQDRENMAFDLSVFVRFGNLAHGKIVLRPLVTAGTEEQERASREFISRYFAILPASSDGATRQEAIQRLVEASTEVSLAGRIEEDSAAGFVHLELPPQLPDVLFEESRRLRPPQVLYDRVSGDLYVYTEWGSGKDRKSGLTPVFTTRRVLDLTVGESAPGTSTISSERIRNGEIVLLVPKAISTAGMEQLTQPPETQSAAGTESKPQQEAETLATMVNAVNNLVELGSGLAVAHRPNPGETQYLLSTLSRLDGKGPWKLSILVHYVKESPHPFRVAVVRHRPLAGDRFQVERTIADRGTNRPGSVLEMFYHVLSFPGVQRAIRELAGEPPAAGVESAEQRVQGLMETILRRAGKGEVDTVAVLNTKGSVVGTFEVTDDAGQVAIAPVEQGLRAALLQLVQSSAGGNVSVVLDAGERELQLRPVGGFSASAPAVTEAGLEDLRTGAAAVAPPARQFAAQDRGAQPQIAGRARRDGRPENGLKEAPANLFKLIFRPENAGLALLLPKEGVQARIIVSSSEQLRLLLEIRPDLAGAILPLEEFDNVESAVEFARSDSQLGPDATEVPLVLSQRSRPLLRWQIETWLRPFPWRPATLTEALLDDVMDILGLQV